MSITKSGKSGKGLQKVVQAMNPALQKVYTTLAKDMEQGERAHILNRYKIGVAVREIHYNESKYGEAAIEKIAMALNRQPSELYAYRSLADTFTREQIEEIIQRRSVDEAFISYSHLRLLSSVPEEKLRNMWLEQFFKETLTVAEMTKRIQDKLGQRSNNSKSLAVATNPVNGLSKLTKMAKLILEEKDGFLKSLEGFQELDEGKINGKLRDRVGETEDVCEQLRQMAEELERRLAAIYEKIDNKVEADEDSKKTSRRSRGVIVQAEEAVDDDEDFDVEDEEPAQQPAKAAKAATGSKPKPRKHATAGK